MFCTTGVLLRQLQSCFSGPVGADGVATADVSSLASLTHLMVDEVHERNVDTDFLLSVIKRLMKLLPKLKACRRGGSECHVRSLTRVLLLLRDAMPTGGADECNHGHTALCQVLCQGQAAVPRHHSARLYTPCAGEVP